MNRTALSYLVIDPSWFRMDIGSDGKGLPHILTKETADMLETIGRTYCHQIYRRRFDILSEIDSDSETDTDEENYSLHDSTSDINSSIECSSDEDSF